MSISYFLEIATSLSAADVAGKLREVIQGGNMVESSTTVDELLNGKGTNLGTWIRVRNINPEPFNPVVEDFGFTQTVSALFRLGNDHAPYLQQDDMIRAVSGLLSEVSGDAILHLQYEQIWLLRQGGELIVSNQYDVWTPRRLAMIPPPFRRAAPAFVEWDGAQGADRVDPPAS